MDISNEVKRIGGKVKSVKKFPAHGTFLAVGDAESYLRENGYCIGSMQRNAPIGFAGGDCEYVSKWRNMTRDEHKSLDGVILSDDFREGDVSVVFFK